MVGFLTINMIVMRTLVLAGFISVSRTRERFQVFQPNLVQFLKIDYRRTRTLASYQGSSTNSFLIILQNNFTSMRAVDRMVDFIRDPGNFFKYHSNRGKFRSLGPPFQVRAPVKITASPSLSTALISIYFTLT